MAKTTLKIEGIQITINNNPISIKGFEIETEADVHEIAASGGNFNHLVETIGNIAEAFDNNDHTEIKVEAKEIEDKPKVEVKAEPNEIKPVKVKKPELPVVDFREVKTEKPKFNITKEWRKISVPEELKPNGTDKYRWCGDTIGETVSVDGGTYAVVYIHINSMGQKSFIIVRPENVKFEDDIKPEEFQEFLETINIPETIKEYIKKVIEL